MFPDRTLAPGQDLVLDGIRFAATEVGAAESPTDSYWTVGTDSRLVVLGDLASNDLHSFLGNGTSGHWLRVLRRLERDLPCEAVLHLGHGAIAGPDVLTRQAAYLREFRRQVRRIGGGAATLRPEQVEELGRRMVAYLGNGRKANLIPLGAAAVARELAR